MPEKATIIVFSNELDKVLAAFNIATGAASMEMEVGQTLEVISINEAIKEDMPAWYKVTGNEYLGLEQKGNI